MNKTINDYSSDDMSDTDSDLSDPSHRGIFKSNQEPLVLELHELKKDEPPAPAPETDENQPTVAAPVKKSKKEKKKAKGKVKNEPSIISNESSIAPVNVETKEEFYDAHESYHALPADNQSQQPLVAAATTRLETHIENVETPDVQKVVENQSGTPSVTETAKEPSTITKPVTGPN